MTISPIATTSSSANAGVQSSFQQQRSEFKQLSQALQSGDLGAAQKAYTALTQGATNSSSSLNQNSPLAQDFQAIGKALQSGDINGAQTAFAQLQKDATAAASSQSQQAQGNSRAHRGHHHHHGGGSSDSTSATTTSGSSSSSNGATTGTVVNLFG